MALINCPECGKTVSDKAVACPQCGCPIAGSFITAENLEDQIALADSEMDNEDNTISDIPASQEQNLFTTIEEDTKNEETNCEELSANAPVDKDSIVEPVQEKIEKGVSPHNSFTEENSNIKKNNQKLHKKTWFIILMLIVFFPVGIYLMLKSKKFKKPARIICSILFGLNFLFWLLILIILALPCNHEWQDATCTTPKTCLSCGEIEGDVLDHNWIGATCTTPNTCSLCGKTEGDALNHSVDDWTVEKEATCQEEGLRTGKCTECNEVVSEKLDKAEHSPGKWEVTKTATSTEDGEKSKLCKVCGKVLKTKTYEISAEERKKAFKDECKSYTYNEIARNPDDYEGKSAKFTGEVIQVIEDGNSYTLRVNITKGSYYWDDTILVSYYRTDDSESRILEDDIITMYGTLAGTYTYETVMGSSLTVPLFYAEYIDFN